MLGNIEQESQLNPGIWQNWHNTEKLGYGLVQWSPAKGFLEEVGLNADSADNLANTDAKKLMDLELDFLIYTCTVKDYTKNRWIATSKYSSPYIMKYEEYIKSEHSPEDLALVFHASYERSNDNDKLKNTRANNARKWYNYFD